MSTESKQATSPKTKPSPREERLKQALKSNMARRKAQARARAAEADHMDEIEKDTPQSGA